MKHITRTLAAVAIVGLGVAASAPAFAASGRNTATSHSTAPRNDAFTVNGGVTSVIDPQANDPKGLQIVSNTKTAHGTLTRQSDGTFIYTPDKGFHGTDSFTYSTSDGVSLYSTDIAPLGTVTGVNISGGAYGSAVTTKPGNDKIFYGLTDRGPNVDGPNGTKVEPLPDFEPAIGEFTYGSDGQAVLLKTIRLKGTDGKPLNGLENPEANAGETITDMDGNVLPTSDHGLDTEGLVAASDGTFWVSDEYGPYIVHFDSTGKEIGRLSPYDGTLPAELKFREPNKGMEGLTVTPDGKTLVGIMQSALTIDSDHQAKSKNIPFTRIVTYDLKTKAVHEYAYVLDDPATTGTAVSEITAVSATKFLVDERDGNMEPGAYKKIYEIDLSKATDIGPDANVENAHYDATYGLEVDGVGPLEYLFTDKSQSPDGQAILTANHITPVKKSLYLDLGALVTKLDPTGGFFGHDKVEGIDLIDGGTKLLVSNDSDFGIDGLADASGEVSTDVTAPFTLHAKTLPNGQQDDGEYLVVDLAKANDAVKTATVSIRVR
ncbi:esterase-like activity of phytase family protein [Gryllotalpicola ginsengisoli]|uniref:esterase-like activity of phytase family protein n=1 Tax=Gryllotalpicola ginsengisoli TaxID=444608 RepID=UPI0003B332DD|nr:esterase-like activity of phytase family protein [Gryllotalpicola ginsengisoli]